jgi:RNA polymerase primary sigma factor
MRSAAAREERDSVSFAPDEASLPLYLKQIGKTKPLTLDEEAVLAVRIRKGDRKALNKLVHANLRFVVSVSMNYRNQGQSITDLINEGNLGLIRAARRFDETKKFKFISYAVWWIRQAILQSLAEQSRIIKMPLNRVGAIYKVGKMFSRLEQKLKRAPTANEIAGEMDIDHQEVSETMSIGNTHTSLDAPTKDGEDGKLLDLLQDKSMDPPDSCVADISLRKQITVILSTLTKRESEVVRLYFGIDEETGHTLEEIGSRFNLTRERVRQIKEKALRRLKHTSRSQSLRIYK